MMFPHFLAMVIPVVEEEQLDSDSHQPLEHKGHQNLTPPGPEGAHQNRGTGLQTCSFSRSPKVPRRGRTGQERNTVVIPDVPGLCEKLRRSVNITPSNTEEEARPPKGPNPAQCGAVWPGRPAPVRDLSGQDAAAALGLEDQGHSLDSDVQVLTRLDRRVERSRRGSDLT